jgi:hypothetical protein
MIIFGGEWAPVALETVGSDLPHGNSNVDGIIDLDVDEFS